jgi:hypothetical protein
LAEELIIFFEHFLESAYGLDFFAVGLENIFSLLFGIDLVFEYIFRTYQSASKKHIFAIRTIIAKSDVVAFEEVHTKERFHTIEYMDTLICDF